MDEIQSFDIETYIAGDAGGSWAEKERYNSVEGEYVLYTDHKKIVDELKKELEEARERYVQLWTRSNFK